MPGQCDMTTPLYTVTRGTGTPKERDEVNRREVSTQIPSVMGECVILTLQVRRRGSGT